MPSVSKKARSQPPRIALLFETPNACARGILLGIGDYILSHGLWRAYLATFSNRREWRWTANRYFPSVTA